MTPAEIYNLADARSGMVRTARPELIWSAITEAARSMYLWIKKENAGFFIKWDTTTIAMANTVEEYTCPADLDQIVRFSERINAQDRFREILPTNINAQLFRNSQFETLVGPAGAGQSIYSYIGPYLPGATGTVAAQAADEAAAEAEIYKVRIAPTPGEAHQTELVYSAKFIEMRSDKDVCVIPEEGRGALLEYAVANLLAGKDDSKAVAARAMGDEAKELYLTSVRDRQIQQYSGVQPYLDQLD